MLIIIIKTSKAKHNFHTVSLLTLYCICWPYIAFVDHILYVLTLYCTCTPYIALFDFILHFLTWYCTCWPDIVLVDLILYLLTWCCTCWPYFSLLTLQETSEDVQGHLVMTDVKEREDPQALKGRPETLVGRGKQGPQGLRDPQAATRGVHQGLWGSRGS